MHVVIPMSVKRLFNSLMVHISTFTFLGFIMCKAGAATKTSYTLFPKQNCGNGFSQILLHRTEWLSFCY